MKQPEQPNNGDRNPGRSLQAMGLVTAIGVDLAGCTLGGYYLGNWLGDKWGNPGLWIGAGVLFGMLSGALSIVSIIKKVMRDNNE
ncbi:AtpZ/AtpI family protein [Paenibacillus sp. HN-1]|uniref:AtpZ/AtpI family protein n=1 Tax=Paenibacillus sp. CGMCC 1.18879 TaxID=2834466 RepID=UPI001CAA1304|nr:AtpZ/AtpI family protein [Paenibacillus sp. CGMCC 1.18879]MBY9077651.1 AtpZ/AtpI family protein [Paenibacillus sp. CGMCC 1.18879]MBY9087424.1 AtpZ/AtpI family protein [Paenibacillus sinensis]